MANYPCIECGSLVSTSGDGVCKKCKSKKPFKCSKCGKATPLYNVFKPEKLTVSGKPIYCSDCGSDNEIVKCARCGQSLSRSTGLEVPVNGVLKVYHKECLEQQKSMYRKFMPLIIAVTAIVLFYASYMCHAPMWLSIAIGLLFGTIFGKGIADKFLGLK